MNLKIIQQFQKSWLECTESIRFSVTLSESTYNICINQCGYREIIIESSCDDDRDALIKLYNDLSALLMLLDGYFVPVTEICIDGQDITRDFLEHRVSCYTSADFMLGSSGRLLDFHKVLDDEILLRWIDLRKELDIIHNMVLYCLSDVEMPKDMQCAFMIETFEGLKELVEDKKPEIKFGNTKCEKRRKESKLAKYLIAFINHYGGIIFENEIRSGIENFAQVLVNSRNRIGHIKRNQNRVYLKDGENVVYLMKLSLLYRIVLFDILGIPKDIYEVNLSSRTNIINNWRVTKEFLGTLQMMTVSDTSIKSDSQKST